MTVIKKLNKKNYIKFVERSSNFAHKSVWRLKTQWSGDTAPVFIFGSQRSGTTMLGECLERSPEIENLGEGDPRAFEYNSLLEIEKIDDLVSRNPYKFLVFKPLKDSHRALELLDRWPEARGIWMYRNYADRVNSAVELFGRHPLDVFTAFKNSGKSAWQLQGISPEDASLIKSIRFEDLTIFDAAALMWYIRNKLYYNLQLDNDSRIRLISYEFFVADPEKELQQLASFLKCSYSKRMTSSIHGKSVGKNKPPQLDPTIEALCNNLHDRLDKSWREKSALCT